MNIRPGLMSVEEVLGATRDHLASLCDALAVPESAEVVRASVEARGVDGGCIVVSVDAPPALVEYLAAHADAVVEG